MTGRQVNLPIIPITAEAFAPYGRLFRAEGSRDFGRDGYDGWIFPFRAEGAVRLQLVRYHPRARQVLLIERHRHVTETRQPVAGPAAVLVVGAPSEIPPRAEDMVAFDLGNNGIMLHPGTWHSIDAYPVTDSPSDYLFLSEEATVRELFDGTPQPLRTQVHDLAGAGIDLRFG
jgi:ureidoglycolate hydrolase